MSDPTKEKVKIKKLACGGHAIYGVDNKTKQLIQVGYIGPNLPLDGYLSEYTLEK